MSLKTDYVDAVFTGDRQYEISDSSDGKKTIKDVTEYETQGSKFGAKDINATNSAINKSNGKKTITLTSSGWSSSSPYTQTVSVEGITEEDLPIPILDTSSSTDEANEKQMKKQFGWLTYYDTASEEITFTAKYNKPTMDLKIDLKGV